MTQILHSNIEGSGTPLLILHGFLGMSDNWKTLSLRYAEEKFEVHSLDQRNHGRSFHSTLFNYDAMANDLKNYCDYHQLKKIDLIGHSMGGKTAMLFATKHPEYINKLIIADIAPKQYPQHHQDILKGLNALDFKTITTRQEADQQLKVYIPHPSVRQFLLKNLYRKNNNTFALRINLPVLTQHIEEVGKALPDSAVFDGKTLFVKGEKSSYIEDIDMLHIQKHFPNSNLKTIASAGHWLHAEKPETFFDITLNFLR